MKIGNSYWKPLQQGIILSTHSVIAISEQLLYEAEVHFFLTGRLTQDCLENLFSTVRQGNAIPTPAAFTNTLKIITVAQFLKTHERLL
jgi:hypothetical protein